MMDATSKKNRLTGLLLALFGSASVVFASPEISVDSANFDMGTIREGSVKSVKHVFKIKNTGDSVLVIRQVKPG